MIGDVVYRRNILFQDSKELDLKLTGHPTITIFEDYDKDIAYYVTITTDKTRSRTNTMYKIPKHKSSGLKADFSYVNLDYIYKDDISNAYVRGYISDEFILEIYKNISSNWDNILKKFDESQISSEEICNIKKNIEEFIKK